MALIGLLGSVGCYSAEPRLGLPCDPITRACPGGQECVDTGGGSFCLAPGSPSDDAGGGDDTMMMLDDAGTDSPMIAMPDALMHIEYMAVVADCINPATPDPDGCIAANGAGQLVVDSNDSTTMNPWQGYVKFDVDGMIAGRTVMAVHLRMVATSDAKAPSPNSGSVWQVAPFTRTSLATTTPATIGNVLAGSQGAVAANQPVNWSLPTSLVSANASVYLGLTSASSDGVNYWNSTGTTPPRLVIDLQ